jgi:integrase
MEFTRTGVSYLIRRRKSGVYYWHTKIGGVSRRGSLGTKSQSVAKTRLNRYIERAKEKFESIEVIGSRGDLVRDWVEIWVERQKMRPELKERTRLSYEERARRLGEGFPWSSPVRTVGPDVFRKWWSARCGELAPARANDLLRVVKSIFAMLQEDGVRGDDPVRSLSRVPVSVPVLVLPTTEEFQKLVESIRGQGKRCSEEVADMVEWIAYSGLRVAEARGMRWEDVQDDVLVVRGDAEGTKNRRERLVPIIEPLRTVIDRRRWEGASGLVFSIKSPIRGLQAACSRLGFPRYRVHDLRHLFGTVAIESGVDVPTVAEWMGHRDRGALLLERYTHIRRQHSMEQAKRVRF